MCSLVILLRPGTRWPVVIGANRDERLDRAWQPPARHWADRPEVVAGLDEVGGGSWLGLNDEGVVAGVLDRAGTLGPAAGKRSRGELVLEALDHADAAAAAAALTHLDPRAYRPFNLVVADNRDAFCLSLREDGPGAGIRVETIAAGLSMAAEGDLNSAASPRVARFRPLFAGAAAPDPDGDRWVEWERLLARRDHDPQVGPRGAMCIVTDAGFGTTSSALIALPAVDLHASRPVWRFAAGPPGDTPWTPIDLA